MSHYLHHEGSLPDCYVTVVARLELITSPFLHPSGPRWKLVSGLSCPIPISCPAEIEEPLIPNPQVYKDVVAVV